MRHIILLFLCCCAIIVSVASFFPSAVCNVPDFSQNNPSLFRDSGRRVVVPVSNVSRFCNVMNMRRPGGGGGRLKKQKSGTSKMKIAGIDVSVTNVLIAVNLAVFLALKKYPRLANRFMKYDRAIAAGQRYRLFTSVFLHKALYHVGANSYSLYQIGPMADIIFGPSRFFCTYLFSGVFANVLTYMFKSSPASLGASGCTFGIIGAFATHFYRNRAILGKAQSDSGKLENLL
jgi:membrane associated rhomboid family serine protease